MINIMCVPIEQPLEFGSSNDVSGNQQQLFPFADRQRRRSPSYVDGRRFMDGQPTSPKTPTKLWEDTIFRVFVTKLFCKDINSLAVQPDLKMTKSATDILSLRCEENSFEVVSKLKHVTNECDENNTRPSLSDTKIWRSLSESALSTLRY